MIRVLMCGPSAKSGGVATHTKSLTEELKKLGTVVISYNFSGSNFKKIYQRTVGLALNAIYKRTEYDIIHVQASGGIFSFISAITGAIVARKLNKRLVVTFHNSQTLNFVEEYRSVFGFVLNNSDKFILVSSEQKKAVISLFRDTSRVVIIPNGFDKSLYYPMDKEMCRAKLNLPLDKKIVFNISNLIESKGHTYLLSAISKVTPVTDNLLCCIAGKGYYRDTLITQCAELQLQNYVKFLGWLPDEQIPVWMNACDLFVHPSLAESFGIVQIEAMACGKPVVATINGGSECIITSDDYGLLVESADPDGLARNILMALDCEWDQETILRYAERFIWENVAKETMEEYTWILE
ncbi:MAG: glycosyltransferase [Fastidiosipilaceae bacterium]|jgi:teichuronic acid biosynthesis glycosyltransferase TuaC